MGGVWTPERRIAAAERTRKQMADPARRKVQAEIMRAVRREPLHIRTWLESRRRPERCAIDSNTMRQLRADPVIEARRKRGSAHARTARAARERGGAIPDGYEALYRHLRNKQYSAKEALRLVRLQRGADLRGDA